MTYNSSLGVHLHITLHSCKYLCNHVTLGVYGYIYLYTVNPYDILVSVCYCHARFPSALYYTNGHFPHHIMPLSHSLSTILPIIIV